MPEIPAEVIRAAVAAYAREAYCDGEPIDGDERVIRAALEAATPLLAGAGEGATVKTEWGVRYAQGRVGVHGTGPDNEHHARGTAASEPGALVRRTVTYGPWEEVPGER